jgi:hypothetical protein
MEDRFKDKCTHKNKNSGIQTQMKNMFITVELFYGTWGKEGKEKRMIGHQ